jgi:hypothetical protein
MAPYFAERCSATLDFPDPGNPDKNNRKLLGALDIVFVPRNSSKSAGTEILDKSGTEKFL